jgi:hypothetical protein
MSIATNGVLNINGAGSKLIYGVLTNAGTVRWTTGDLVLRGDNNLGQIYNLAGGLFDVQNDQTIFCFSCNSPSFNNAGLFRKSAGSTTTTVNVRFNNTGAVDAQMGQVTFADGSAFHTGTVFMGAGTSRLLSGTIAFDGAIVSTNAELAGATLSGTSTISGTMNWTTGTIGSSAAMSIATNGVLNMTGVGGKLIYGLLTNAGTVRWTGGSDLILRGDDSLGQVHNLAGSVFDVQNDQTLTCTFCTSTLLNNAGLFRKSEGNGTTTVGVAFNSSGTVDVPSGRISFNGVYTQTGGALSFGISSLTDFGQIHIAGTAPLTGALNINLRNGFQPSLSNSFPVMSYVSHTGTFATVTGCSIGNGLFFDVLYQSQRLLLIAKDGAPHLDSAMNNGQFRFRLTTGTVGQTYIIEASTTLTNWIPIGTNTLPDCVLDFVDGDAVNFPHRFYRAVLVR